ncbi:unnamed protein product [Chondrus crispus]|uniref:Uncharacterized protein n=1 Tax=Chondrus crispus TaxID=2769 RepID=R7QEM3_CHOCR|nr:unnamed protein product [Chondrus crispus]CDF36499.1 unnamed protein product [Chondrus crispus]|eukprot:XP_005716318.1 unnamed protein product [Chondrus crispus]
MTLLCQRKPSASVTSLYTWFGRYQRSISSHVLNSASSPDFSTNNWEGRPCNLHLLRSSKCKSRKRRMTSDLI